MRAGTLRSTRVLVGGQIKPAEVSWADGEITAIGNLGNDTSRASNLIDVGDLVVFPGLVDSHVHVNEPGRTEWEGFETATRAAVAGGTTTIVDMPLNSIPPTVTEEALAAKVAAAAGKVYSDVAFWGGLVPGSIGQLSALSAAGVKGFKAFLVDSGVPEFGHVAASDLIAATGESGAKPIIVHAELPEPMKRAQQQYASAADPRSYQAYLASRPPEAETAAVEAIAETALATGAHFHVLHLSAAEAIPMIAAARSAGALLTAETCPHYLAIAAEKIPDGATEYKCAPPIRDEDNRVRLWQGLRNGVLDMVVSDHSPAPADLKEVQSGDFRAAWGGISSVELRLPVTWTSGRAIGASLADLGAWLAKAPAGLAGLGRKGEIAVGHDADFVVWDPESEWLVDADKLNHRHPLSPYAGYRLTGVVEQTWLRGSKVYDRGSFTEPAGELLL